MDRFFRTGTFLFSCDIEGVFCVVATVRRFSQCKFRSAAQGAFVSCCVASSNWACRCAYTIFVARSTLRVGLKRRFYVGPNDFLRFLKGLMGRMLFFRLSSFFVHCFYFSVLSAVSQIGTRMRERIPFNVGQTGSYMTQTSEGLYSGTFSVETTTSFRSGCSDVVATRDVVRRKFAASFPTVLKTIP